MYKFATGVFFSASDLINVLKVVRKYKSTALPIAKARGIRLGRI
jgi:hypothetical protein